MTKKKKGLSKFTILPWAAFTAILGRTQPAAPGWTLHGGRGAETPRTTEIRQQKSHTLPPGPSLDARQARDPREGGRTLTFLSVNQ